ncbi:SapC family protein [Sphingomonas sp.]|uniref:SapC family protein n=1 Tax=Sphingomonas sp. TaxID=28214 RepID=UPI001B25E30D|nr:SapC family protein [Sphingomonas sp.]MBO9713738.1 SapC family protein [Sphingomonas sp.]
MTNRVLLNNVDHPDLTVAVRHGAEFGDQVNQLLVFPTEFAEIQREFPILFQPDGDGGYNPVALLGLERDENLFLGPEGWESRYIPAIQRRGPFSIALKPGEDEPEVMIEVDLDDPRVGRNAGELLFLEHGGSTPYLLHVTDALRTIYEGHQAIAPMFAAFEAHGLLRPVDIEIALNEERRIRVTGYFAIDDERLASLDGAALEVLNRSGFLRLAMLVSASLANLQRLIERKGARG